MIQWYASSKLILYIKRQYYFSLHCSTCEKQDCCYLYEQTRQTKSVINLLKQFPSVLWVAFTIIYEWRKNLRFLSTDYLGKEKGFDKETYNEAFQIVSYKLHY